MKWWARLSASFATVLLSFVLMSTVAHANPANLQVVTAMQPWWSGGKTTALTNVDIHINTVPECGLGGFYALINPAFGGCRIPIFLDPYNGNMLSPNCIFGGPCNAPTTNSVNFGMDAGLAITEGNFFCNPVNSCQTSSVFLNNFAWCGVNRYSTVPNNLGVGDFKMQVSVTERAPLSAYGGHWVMYSHWASLDQTVINNQYGPADGSSLQVQANNDNTSLVMFLYVENPPSYNHYGFRVDRFGNPSPTSGTFGNGQQAKTRMDYWDALPWATNANPWGFTGINGGQGHHFSADSTNDWAVTGWSVMYNSAGGWQFGTSPPDSYDLGSFQGRVDSRFFYEPKKSTINAGLKVRDNASGGVYNPCNSGKFTQSLCGTTTLGMTQLDGANGVRRPGTQDVSQNSNFVNSYTLDTSATPNASSNPIGVGNLYYGYYRLTAPPKSGYKIVGWLINGSFVSTASYTYDQFINPNSTNQVEPVYEPTTVQLRVIKRGPNAPYGTSDTQDIGVGDVRLNGTLISGAGSTWGWSTVYFNGAQSTIQTDTNNSAGWQVRGYAFCVGNPWNTPDCTNDGIRAGGAQDQTNGSKGPIITPNNGDNMTNLSLNLDTSNPTATFNTQPVATGQELYLVIYYKPKPMRQMVRSMIDRESPSNGVNNLNPCSIADHNDYKYRDLCNKVDIRVKRGPTGIAPSNYVPIKPGYNYSLIASQMGTNTSVSGASEWIKPGNIWRGAGNTVADAGAQSENLAIFDGLYPGNYTAQYNNESFTPKLSDGKTPAYSVLMSNCADGTSNCSNNQTKQFAYGYCPLNFGMPQGGNYGVKADSGISESRWWTNCQNQYGSNEGINLYAASPSVRLDQLTQYSPFGYSFTAGGCFFWACWPDQVNNPNNQDYSYFTRDRNLFPGLANGYAESNMMWKPTIELRSQTINCDTVTADITYGPDPSRHVKSYITLDDVEVKDPDTGQRLLVESWQGNPASFTMPKRQYGTNAIWKDGRAHALRFFTIYDDPDLQGTTSTQGGFPVPKYNPATFGPYTYQCQNHAACDPAVFSASVGSLATSDTGTPIKVNVKMTNDGKSYWITDKVAPRGSEPAGPVSGKYSVDTKHFLGPISGMKVESVDGPIGWTFSNINLADEEISPVGAPASDNPSANSSKTFSFNIFAPKDATTSTLGFNIYQTDLGNAVPTAPLCQINVIVRPNYHPWTRVQNGDVNALGSAVDQPETSRGTYKAQNSKSFGTKGWYNGTAEENAASPSRMNPVADLNQHAQYVIASAAAAGGLNFCSANWYLMGANSGANLATVPALTSTNCASHGQMDFNIDTGVRSDFTTPPNGTDSVNTIFDAANNSYSNNGQCDDSGATADVNDGPNPLGPIKQYYRSWAPGSGSTAAANLVITQANLSDTNSYFTKYGNGAFRLVNIQNLVNIAGNDGAGYSRPCPTLIKLLTPPKPGVAGSHSIGDAANPIRIGAGRATLIVDGDLYIQGDIKNDYATGQAFDYKQGFGSTNTIDLAGLNKLPNLGIIVKGNITVESNVKDIQANLFATGSLITCSDYSAGSIDGGGNDTGGTQGTHLLYPQKVDPTTLDPLAKEPPNGDNPTASKCNNRLSIRGAVAASQLRLGRNFVDFQNMINNFANNKVRNIFTNGTDSKKFCNKSTAAGIQHICTDSVTGQRLDFDAPGTYIDAGVEKNYLSINGYPQSNYFGGPAEDFMGNGITSILPPPGFDNITTDAFSRPKFVQQNAKPRF